MTLEQHNTRIKGHFTAKEGDIEMGRLYYSWTGINMFNIDHTEVYPAFKGKGVGEFLVESVVEYARTNNFKVVPLCAFADAMFKRHKEWKDVLFE